MKTPSSNHSFGNSIMKPASTFSPTSLRYIAALRSHKPAASGAAFTYAEVGCKSPEALICLAASNPEGRFYGFVADENGRRNSENDAAERGIFNAIFLVGSPSQILARIDNGSSLPPMLDYLCCDESENALDPAERIALFDLAHKRLQPRGMLVTTYRPCANEGDAFAFLAHEAAPQMNADQKQEFLIELKHLGASYLARHSDMADRLKDAIVKGTPDAFFAHFSSPVASQTFATMAALGQREMAFAGDARVAYNYVELSVPAAAQNIVAQCRDSLLYEPIKDVVLDRTVRSDIWIKGPFELSNNPTELFGGFAYGIPTDRNAVPAAYAAQGKVIDLSTPLYSKLIELMSTLPMGIGDFMAHPSGMDEKPDAIIEAIQILVACGFAQPMRGMRKMSRSSNVSQPRLVGAFNRFIDKTALVGDKDVHMSSPVLGCAVVVTVRDALVMQALNRAGLENSVSALMPELQRMAEDSTLHHLHIEGEVTAEIAHKMVLDAVGSSLPQWYAYGLLEAA